MKALSLTQPYANFIRDGIKTIETRKWKTNYRGPILICATKQKVKNALGQINLPTGMAVCIIDIIDCRKMTRDDEEEACFPWDEKLWAWPLDNLKVITPFPVKGQLNIFNVDYEDQS